MLIHAGSGGVGHMAVQLAKQYWNAYAVSTARNVDFVKVGNSYLLLLIFLLQVSGRNV